MARRPASIIEANMVDTYRSRAKSDADSSNSAVALLALARRAEALPLPLAGGWRTVAVPTIPVTVTVLVTPAVGKTPHVSGAPAPLRGLTERARCYARAAKGQRPSSHTGAGRLKLELPIGLRPGDDKRGRPTRQPDQRTGDPSLSPDCRFKSSSTPRIASIAVPNPAQSPDFKCSIA